MADVGFPQNGVSIFAPDEIAYVTINEYAVETDENQAILTSTDWDNADSALQIVTEQLAFENRAVILNKFIGERELNVEYNMQTSNAYSVLDVEKMIRKTQTSLQPFSITRAYTNYTGIHRTEGFKECYLMSFNFTPQGDRNYTVKMMFKVLDSRKYVTEGDNSYRMI